jgi:hypothetical protein
LLGKAQYVGRSFAGRLRPHALAAFNSLKKRI